MFRCWQHNYVFNKTFNNQLLTKSSDIIMIVLKVKNKILVRVRLLTPYCAMCFYKKNLIYETIVMFRVISVKKTGIQNNHNNTEMLFGIDAVL